MGTNMMPSMVGCNMVDINSLMINPLSFLRDMQSFLLHAEQDQ
jgi:hypothetical protein